MATPQKRNRNRGKDAERKAALLFGGKRMGTMGGEDVLHPTLSIEVKSVMRFIGDKWFKQAEKNNKRKVTPVVVVTQKHCPMENGYILIKVKDFLPLLERSEAEKTADEDIRTGRVSEVFETASEGIAHLHRERDAAWRESHDKALNAIRSMCATAEGIQVPLSAAKVKEAGEELKATTESEEWWAGLFDRLEKRMPYEDAKRMSPEERGAVFLEEISGLPEGQRQIVIDTLFPFKTKGHPQ